jgi:hypothetical protein
MPAATSRTAATRPWLNPHDERCEQAGSLPLKLGVRRCGTFPIGVRRLFSVVPPTFCQPSLQAVSADRLLSMIPSAVVRT